MNAIKAYTNSGINKVHNWSMSDRGLIAGGREREKKVLKSSGDSLSLSQEARDMLKAAGDSVSFCPQDATYDNKGYVLRQVENLQGDLRQLSSQMLNYPDAGAIAGKLRGMQYQLGSLQAQV